MKKKIKMEKYENDDIKLIKKLLLILLIIVLVILGLYVFTDKVVMEKQETNVNEVEFDYDTATIGTILNRPYDEYMVLLYNSKEDNATYYSTLLAKYTGDEKLYFVDLSLKSSEKYISDTSSGIFISINDAKFSGPTLLKIKNGKVIKFLETKEEIKENLSD